MPFVLLDDNRHSSHLRKVDEIHIEGRYFFLYAPKGRQFYTHYSISTTVSHLA